MHTPPKILIVDDSNLNTDTIEARLKPQGYECIKARTGAEALRAAEAAPPDIILLDLVLPDMDGFEVLRRLKAMERTRLVPIVALTSLQQSGDKIKALEIGAEEYVTKPFNNVELVTKIGALLRVKRYQDQLRGMNVLLDEKNRDLEQANRLKSEFLANVSHELRTPLNAAIGFAEILGQGTFGDLNAKQTRYVGNIHSSGKHLLQLINDILDLSKVEAGRMDLDIDEFGLADAIHEVEAVVKGIASKKSLTLTLEIDEGAGRIAADQKRFKQILYNLLSNAVKFTPEGGSVRLTAAKAQDGAVELPAGDVEYARVDVTDTGVGIAPEDHEKVFEQFRQLDASYARRQQGTGLGLALTRQLVEMHGGRIWVESELGQGSTFTFCIPAAATDARPRALVVADEESFLTELEHALERGNFRVTCARSANSALDEMGEDGPDVVFLCASSGDPDPAQDLDMLRNRPSTGQVPVIVVTDGIHSDAAKLMAIGAAEFLTRPVSPSIIVDTARKLTKKKTVAITRNDLPEDRVRREGSEGVSRAEVPVTVITELEYQGSLAEMRLLQAGCGVATVNCVEDAVRAARQTEPFAIAFDMGSERGADWGTLRALKSAPETASIPAVPVVLREGGTGLSLGTTDYLEMPVNDDELRRKAALLRRRRDREGESPRVVVVSESSEIGEAVVRGLEPEGYTVARLRPTETVARQIEEHRPQLLVLELVTRDSSALDILVSVRRLNGFAPLLTLIVGGHDLTVEQRKRLGASPDRLREVNRDVAEELLCDIRTLSALGSVSSDMLDALTGLPNGAHLMARLPDQIGRARDKDQALSLALLRLNDLEEAGESANRAWRLHASRQFTTLLESVLRNDDTVARFPDDRFAIVFAEQDALGATKAIRRIQRALRERRLPTPDLKGLTALTACAGVAQLDGTTRDGKQLLRECEEAFRRSQASGGNAIAT